MTLGASMGTHAYGEPSYWDQRYRKDPGPFDWYQKYQRLSPLFNLYIRRSNRVLLVGCGNSTLGEDMVSDGYRDIVNIDISSVVVEYMLQKCENKPELKYITMDVRDMSAFESSSFDAVIDKGTLDSLMCGQNAHDNAMKMLEEVGRVVKNNGVYILITYGDPSYRLRLLKDTQLWSIAVHVIGMGLRPHPRRQCAAAAAFGGRKHLAGSGTLRRWLPAAAAFGGRRHLVGMTFCVRRHSAVCFASILDDIWRAATFSHRRHKDA